MTNEEPLITYANEHLPCEVIQGPGYAITELDPSERITVTREQIWPTRAETSVIAKELLDSGRIELTDDPTVPVTLIKITGSYFGEPVRPDIAALDGKSILSADELPNDLMQAYHADILHEAEIIADPTNPELLRNMYPENYSTIGTVSQVFRLSNGRGAEFNIVSCCPEILSTDQLGRVLEGIREVDQLTGGESSRSINTFFLFRNEDGQPVTIYEPGAPGSNMNVYLGLQPHSFTKEYPGMLEGDKGLAVHELTHVVDYANLRDHAGPKGSQHPFAGMWKRSGSPHAPDDTFVGDVQNPWGYGQQNRDEDVATSSRFIHSPREKDPVLDEDRKTAVAKLFQDAHGGIEGPAYIYCEEINLRQLLSEGRRLMPQLSSHTQIHPVVCIVRYENLSES